MSLLRYIVHPLALVRVCALGTLLVVACGGPNVSDKDKRRSTPEATAEGEVDTTPPAEEDAAPTTEVDSSVDETVPDASVADSAPVVPAGSFGVGTELETTAALNLREGPGTEFAIIVEIPNATRVKVAKTSGADGWVNITYDAKTGYSSKDFLKVP